MTRHDTITLYRAPDGWRWRYTAHNGRVLADSGQGYSRRVDAVRDAKRITRALDEAGLLASPERDAGVTALPLPVDGCACTPHAQDAGGGYTEYLLEYEPACPEHSEHLWDPTQGAWVLRSERDAAVAAKALREAADDMDDTDDPDAIHVANGDIDKWLHDRADRIEVRGLTEAENGPQKTQGESR